MLHKVRVAVERNHERLGVGRPSNEFSVYMVQLRDARQSVMLRQKTPRLLRDGCSLVLVVLRAPDAPEEANLGDITAEGVIDRNPFLVGRKREICIALVLG